MITKTQYAALSKMNQCDRVLWWFENKGDITTWQSMEHLGIQRLASRINDLRNRGHVIKTEKKAITNMFGEKITGVGNYVYVGGE